MSFRSNLDKIQLDLAEKSYLELEDRIKKSMELLEPLIKKANQQWPSVSSYELRRVQNLLATGEDIGEYED